MARRTETAQAVQLDRQAAERLRNPGLWGRNHIARPLGGCSPSGLAEGYPASFWISQALNGLVLGGVYALVALGYTLVYGILFMINFAHGEVMMIGGIAGYFALQFAQARGWMEGPWAVVVVALLFIMLIGMAASVLIGVTLERLAYRPLAPGAPPGAFDQRDWRISLFAILCSADLRRQPSQLSQT